MEKQCLNPPSSFRSKNESCPSVTTHVTTVIGHVIISSPASGTQKTQCVVEDMI